MNLDIVVGLSNLGPAGRPSDHDMGFDPIMEREAAERLIGELRAAGVAPPPVALEPGDPNRPRSALARINVQLRANGLPTHSEPVDPPRWEPSLPGPLPLDALHRLRRVMAHHLVQRGTPPEPLRVDADAREDPVMAQADERRDNHLIHHADTAGFYLPVSFSQVVHDPTGTTILGGWVGSSYRLAEELREIAPLLDLPPGAGEPDDEGRLATHVVDQVKRDRDAATPWHREQWAWLLHAEAAAMSLAHGLAIVYR